MAELDDRVAQLERELKSIPEILDLHARVAESRFAAVFAELDTIKRELRALPYTLAAMLAERSRGS
jgi:hypothetical protein